MAGAVAEAAAAYSRAFLDLLDREAPVIEFERPVQEARASGASADLLAGLEAAKLLALHSATVERAAQAHQRFTELVLSGGQAQDIARAVAVVLGGDVVILGEQDAPVASSGPVPDVAVVDGPVPDRPVLDEVALRRVVARVRPARRTVCGDGYWAVPATAGTEHLGTLVLRAGPDLPGGDRLILERAAMVTALLLLVRRSVAQAEHRVRGELLSDLLSTPHRNADSFRARALRLGADLDKPHLVIVARAEAAPRPTLRLAAAHLAATRHGLAADYDGHTVLLLPGTDPEATVRRVAAALGAALGRPATPGGTDGGATIGAAGPITCPADIASGYAQARRCVDALLALGRHGAAATMTELGFLGMLLSDRRDVPAFIRSAIGRLLDYDQCKGTELVRTVEAYFRCGSNLSKTKDALHVHVNTVTQRLDRITHLLGGDWQLGERALEIRVAVHLHKLDADSWTA
jgi:sugar diacid utilization regulator